VICVTVRPIVPPLIVDLSGSGSGSASGDPDSSSGYISGSGIPSGSTSGSGQSGEGSVHLVRFQEGADTLIWQTSASGSASEAKEGSGSGSGAIIALEIESGDQESGEESGLFPAQSGASGLPSGLSSGISGSGTSGFFSGGESSGSDVTFIDTKMIDLTARPSGEQELSGINPFDWTDVSGSGFPSGFGSGSAIDFGSGSASGFVPGSASGFGSGSASGFVPGSASGFGSGSASGFVPGSGSGFGTGSASGFVPGSASGFGSGSASGFVPGSGSGFGSGSASGFVPGSASGFGSGSASGFGSGSVSETSTYPGHPLGEASGHIQKQDGEIAILIENEVFELLFNSTIGPEQGRGSVEISGEGSSQALYVEEISISLSNRTLYEDYWNPNEADDLLPERNEQLNFTTQVFDVSDQSPLNTTPPTTVFTTSPSQQTSKAMEEPSVTDGNN